MLREILFLLTSKTVSSESTNYLRSLIKDHHEHYLNLFGVTHALKPKHHFLVHYPRMMEQVGPVSNNSVFRFEAKHRQFKMAANATTCRINLCKTLAIKNQLNYAHRVFQNSVGKPNQCGIYKNIVDVDCINFINAAGIQNIQLHCEYAELNGVTYKPNMVLWHSVDAISHDPVFVKIFKILIQNNKPIFFCNTLSLNYFDQHKQCFNVNVELNFILVELRLCNSFPTLFWSSLW